jgi:hypothetical protein
VRRPTDLRVVPLADVLPMGARPGLLYVTMGPDQWDALLAAAYADGWVLLEVEDKEPVRAYRREGAGATVGSIAT